MDPIAEDPRDCTILKYLDPETASFLEQAVTRKLPENNYFRRPKMPMVLFCF
jgi:hypothetical protein